MFGMTTRKVTMFKHIILPTFCFFYFFVTGCTSTKNSHRKYINYNQNYVDPTRVEVDWKRLYSTNASSQVRSFLNYSKETKNELSEKKIPYASNGIAKNWDDKYLNSKNKYDFMRKNGVDCTRFLWHLYSEKMNLPFNSKTKGAPILSHSFAQRKSNSELKNFVPLKKNGNLFKPQAGDILAFPGHALAVLDPDKCIAIQSASWVCKKRADNGSCVNSATGKEAGVSIYKLTNRGDCENGLWKQLDSPKNKFTAGWRHKALNTWIEKLPPKANVNETITLIGYNISHRYIYFNGAKKPSKTSYSFSKTKNKKYENLDIVSIKIPHDAKSGKLKIYWDNKIKPDIRHTVESNDIIYIEKNTLLSSR